MCPSVIMLIAIVTPCATATRSMSSPANTAAKDPVRKMRMRAEFPMNQ